MTKIEKWIVLTPSSLETENVTYKADVAGKEFLTQLYRQHIKDYPKFFKMDTLCRLGFVAGELLIGNKEISGDGYSIILFNRSGSVANDMAYQKTIEEESYFPSPAVFVYTLPNIITGEIAIRRKINAETSFYLLPEPDGVMMEQIVRSSITPNTKGVICGWTECYGDNDFKAVLFLLGEDSPTEFTAENITRIINR